VGLGAALGAGIHPASSTFRAGSEVTINAPSAGRQPVAWHTLSQVLKLDSIRERIATLTGAEASALRIGVSGDPQSSLTTVYADASSAPGAALLANTAASVAVNFLRQTIDAPEVTRSTFEHSGEAWDLGAGIYVLPPTRIQQARSPAHSGAGSLEVRCVTVVTGGCGPYLRLERTFRKGTAYQAVGWVKAQATTRIRIVLGATPQDVVVSPTVIGGTLWKRLSVTWTPQSDATLAITTFQVMSLGPSLFYIDDVSVGPRAAIKQVAKTPANPTRYETVLPATASRRLDSGRTAAWAAGGAGAGLMVGIAAAAASAAATRRRSRAQATGQETLF
jgi:hypothetical protein